MLGNEQVIQNFYKNYFIYQLLATSEKDILCFLNTIVTSDLYKNCLQVRNGLNQAIVNVGFEKYIDPCASTIAEASENGYRYISIIE